MKFFFHSTSGASLGVAMRLVREEHTVSFYCENKEVGRGLIQRVDRPHQGLEPDTVVLFDADGHGRRADELRRDGYPTLGASTFNDHVNTSPEYQQHLLKFAGIEPTHDLDGASLVAWFNGTDWVAGATALVYRDRRLMNDEVGPDIGFAGCGAVYCKQVRPAVFKHTLQQLTKQLRYIQYIGPVMYHDHTLWVGWIPGVIDTLFALCPGNLGKFLADLARGAARKFVASYDYGVGAMVSTPRSDRTPITFSYNWLNLHDARMEQDVLTVGQRVGVATSVASTVRKAREQLNTRLRSISGTDLMYRTDAGAQLSRFGAWAARQRDTNA